MQDIEEMARIPIVWIASKLDGKTCHTFVKPEDKADRILELVMAGHEDIYEPYNEAALKYLGTFINGQSPF